MRTEISRTFKESVEEICGTGTQFHTGFLVDINSGGIELPCVWLCPLELNKVTGRTEGRKTYTGAMYVIERNDNLQPEEKNEAWGRMELHALRILGCVENECLHVIAIENIRCLPDEFALTGFNSIHIEVQFDVILDYCADRK